MATITFTIDTGEWLYPDSTGVTHEVTNAQTFTMELTDNGATDVQYAVDNAQNVTTTDGLNIEFRPESRSSGNNNTQRFFGPLADTDDATTIHSFKGELVCEDPQSGTIQRFKPDTWQVDDVDSPTSITASFTDQFARSFTWTGVTIA